MVLFVVLLLLRCFVVGFLLTCWLIRKRIVCRRRWRRAGLGRRRWRRRRRRASSGVLCLCLLLLRVPPRQRRLEAHQRTTFVVDEILDETGMCSNHILGDSHLREVLIELPPLYGWLVVVVDLLASAAVASGHIASRTTGTTTRDVTTTGRWWRRRCRRTTGTTWWWYLAPRHRRAVIVRVLGRILLSLRHALIKMRRLSFVLKKQPGKALLELERVEIRAVLVVPEVAVELLVPQNTSRALNVHELEVEAFSHQIVHQNDGTGEAGVLPAIWVRVCDVEARHCLVDDFIASARDHSFDFFLVRILERTGGEN